MASTAPLAVSLQELTNSPISIRPPTFANDIDAQEKENIFQQVLDFIDVQTYPNLAVIIESSQTFGSVFKKSLSEQDNIKVDSFAFMSLNTKRAVTHHIIYNKNNNTIQVGEIDNIANKEAIIANSLSEWLLYLSKEQFADQYREFLTKFVNDVYQKNFDLNIYHDFHSNQPYYKDSIYYLLKHLVGEDDNYININGVFLDDIGLFRQNETREYWILNTHYHSLQFKFNQSQTLINYIAATITNDEAEKQMVLNDLMSIDLTPQNESYIPEYDNYEYDLNPPDIDIPPPDVQEELDIFNMMIQAEQDDYLYADMDVEATMFESDDSTPQPPVHDDEYWEYLLQSTPPEIDNDNDNYYPLDISRDELLPSEIEESIQSMSEIEYNSELSYNKSLDTLERKEVTQKDWDFLNKFNITPAAFLKTMRDKGFVIPTILKDDKTLIFSENQNLEVSAIIYHDEPRFNVNGFYQSPSELMYLLSESYNYEEKTIFLHNVQQWVKENWQNLIINNKYEHIPPIDELHYLPFEETFKLAVNWLNLPHKILQGTSAPYLFIPHNNYEYSFQNNQWVIKDVQTKSTIRSPNEPNSELWDKIPNEWKNVIRNKIAEKYENDYKNANLYNEENHIKWLDNAVAQYKIVFGDSPNLDFLIKKNEEVLSPPESIQDKIPANKVFEEQSVESTLVGVSAAKKKLVEATVNQLSQELSHTLSKFSLQEFLDIMVDNGRFIVDGNIYRIKRDNQVLELNSKSTPLTIVNHLCKGLSDVGKKNTESFLQTLLLPYLTDKVEKELKQDLATHHQSLVKKQELQQKTLPQEILNNPEKLWNYQFMYDREAVNQPLKYFLYQYDLNPLQGSRVGVRIKNLIQNMIWYQNRKNQNNKVIEPTINVSYSGNSIQADLLFNDGMIIKTYSNNNQENYTILSHDRQTLKSGDSLIECLTQWILPKLNIHFNKIDLHKQIGRELEDSFYANYPLLDLAHKYTTVSKGNNAGEIGDITWSYVEHNESGKGMITIWNAGNKTVFNGLQFASYIALQEMKIGNWKDYVALNNYDNVMIEAQKRGKQIIKDHYLGLNSLQRNTLNTSITISNKSNGKFTQDDFQKLIPNATVEDSQKARDYLINIRCLNPQLLDEQQGITWYGGRYNFNYKNVYNPNNVNDGDYKPVVAFPNNSATFVAVRGSDKNYSDDVKENVPGSLDNSDPYYVPASKLYKVIDESQEKHKIIICEGAIDAWAYHCLHPNYNVFAMCGAKINYFLDALMSFKDVIKEKAQPNIEFVYALDNIQLDQDGRELDSTSRKNYYSLYDKMSLFCYGEFMNKFKEELESLSSDTDCRQHFIDLISPHYSEQQIDFAEQQLNDLATKMPELLYGQRQVQKLIGKLIFQFDYLDTGVLTLATPQHPELSHINIKDWGEYLEKIFELRQKQNPELSTQEIHNIIVKEHSPNLELVEKGKKLSLKDAKLA